MTPLDAAMMGLLVMAGLAIAHTYVMYPLMWWCVEKVCPVAVPVPSDGQDWSPEVSLIVAAHNEGEIIAERVRNALASSYPGDLLEIIIASDGSSDETVKRALAEGADHFHVQVLDLNPRRGKVNVLNDAVAVARGDILVFSDANVIFEPDAIQALVTRLADMHTGCVCGRLRFKAPAGALTAHSEGLYWRLETWLKEREGSRGMLLGSNGAIFAMRRSLWQPCPPDTVVEDFFIPMRLLQQGWRVVFEPGAVAWEDAPPARADEFSRRIRIGAGDYQALSRLLPMLDPRRGWSAFVFLSHKVLRWLGPFCLLAMLVANLWLACAGFRVFQLMLALQALIYSIALAGMAAERGHSRASKIPAALAHFVTMNAALFLGFWRWLRRSQQVTWLRTRRSGEINEAG